jgi:hypothetical protein
VAAVTARRLEHVTGTPSGLLARLLAAVRRTEPGVGQPVGLPQLLTHTHAGTLVLVGDTAQLPEVDAGGLFAVLTRHPETIELTDNRRQTEPWERRTFADLRAGDAHAAVDPYARHDRIRVATTDEVAEALVDDYLRHVADRPSFDSAQQVLMPAVHRADVAQPNDFARAKLLATGRLGADAVNTGKADPLGPRTTPTSQEPTTADPSGAAVATLTGLLLGSPLDAPKTLTTRQLPRPEACRWRWPRGHDADHRRAEGMSR